MQATTHPEAEAFRIRNVPLTRPLIWLARGWQDLLDHPLPSLAYGVIVTFLGSVVLLFNHHPYLIAGSISVFLLVGPVMTAGLCELSRRRDTGEIRDFEASLRGLRHNRVGLVGFARRLLLLSLVWMLVSSMMLHIVLGEVAPSLSATVWGNVWGQLSAGQVLSYLPVGGVLAAFVFAMSVVSVPMILDLNADADEAIRTSWRVFWRDLPAMLVWASLIVLLVGAGFATFLVGMVFIFPWLGHATWQAYRDLVH